MTASFKHPRTGLFVSNDETVRNFCVRAEVDPGYEVLAAYQVPHKDGRDFWVVAAYDEDSGAYATTWLDGEFTGYVFFETADDPTLGKGAAKGAALGYARGYCDRDCAL